MLGAMLTTVLRCEHESCHAYPTIFGVATAVYRRDSRISTPLRLLTHLGEGYNNRSALQQEAFRMSRTR